MSLTLLGGPGKVSHDTGEEYMVILKTSAAPGGPRTKAGGRQTPTETTLILPRDCAWSWDSGTRVLRVSHAQPYNPETME